MNLLVKLMVLVNLLVELMVLVNVLVELMNLVILIDGNDRSGDSGGGDEDSGDSEGDHLTMYSVPECTSRLSFRSYTLCALSVLPISGSAFLRGVHDKRRNSYTLGLKNLK